MALFVNQAFPSGSSTVAPDPSHLWAGNIRRAPLPTNSGWQNFVLNNGSCPEYLHPYMIQSAGGKLSICYPTRGVDPYFIFQAFVGNLTVSCREEFKPHVVTSYDDLSVTLEFGSYLRVPLVRGCPYVTCIYRGGTPVFSTQHAILDVRSNSEDTRHKVVLNNGQTWIIYASSKLKLEKDLTVATRGGFTGVVRIALNPSGVNGEKKLDEYSRCYPVGGVADFSGAFRVKYMWTTVGSGGLLMLSMPHHRTILRAEKVTLVPEISYVSIDGPLMGVVGDGWTLKTEPLDIGWDLQQGLLTKQATDEIIKAATQEVDQICPAKLTITSTYFGGKALARAARLGLIAQEVKYTAVVDRVRIFLIDNLTPWLNGTIEDNGFIYDGKWGGMVSRAGVLDSGADFGLGMYNDHHFHLGYFCYAGAVLAKLDINWGAAWNGHLNGLVSDYMTLDPKDESFTRLRNFDPWVLHSWAGGLVEFNDGRNQESTSEAVNAYYAAALLGDVYDNKRLKQLALTLTSLEIMASKALWHVKADNEIYEQEFVRESKVVGVLWANKRDTNLWFAPREYKETCLGIQVIPISPATKYLFSDIDYAKELVNYALPSLTRKGVTDGWRGFVFGLMALYDPNEAHRLIRQLKSHDDGNSLTNLLWWVHSVSSSIQK